MTSTDERDARPTVRPTRQRRAVAAALGAFDDFRSAQEIHDLISRQGESVGLATVYRTLAALAEAGEVDMLRNEDWNYAVFTTGKQQRAGVNQAECLACHKPLDKVSYTFTLDQLTAAAKK